MGTPQKPSLATHHYNRTGSRHMAWQTSNYHLAYPALVFLCKQHGAVATTINHKYLGLYCITYRQSVALLIIRLLTSLMPIIHL